MAERNSTSWFKNVAAFCANPRSFLSTVTVERFVDDLLKNLKSENLTVLMLNLFLEFPTLLCPEKAAGELTAEILINILQQMSTSVKSISLRCHLLLAIETVLITTDNFNWNCKVAQDFASLLTHLISDINDKKQGSSNRPVRVMACECLRELECCYPGLLSQRLEHLYTMQQQEMTSAHQSYTLLYSVTLKNAVQILAQKEGPSNGTLKQMLMSNDSFLWSATKDMKELQPSSGEQLFLLPSNNETKELKSILALLLEDSYLFTAECQNTLFWQIIQIVAMVRTISPVIFKSQLVRLFGTKDISCFHSILQMKAVFTDSLFTAEDEHFLLQRLVGMTQHPLLSTPVKLFYLDCLLHFPENRPLSSNPGENLPVLLTVQMTSALFPNIFNDCTTMLCRQNFLSMVYLENEGYRSERGIGYLFEHLMALYSMVDKNADREITATFFRSVYLFVRYFNFCEKHMEDLTKTLLDLYKSQSSLALYFINLINQTQILLEFQPWQVSLCKGLQRHIVNLPVGRTTMKCLQWHLKVLSRVAQEKTIPQTSTVLFLRRLVFQSDLCQKGDWGMGNALLSVCKHILQHEHLKVVFMHLADLLQHLMHRFEDIDIQDHSRLYYILLANVSGDKLDKILNMSPMGGPTKTRSLSSIMSESENFSTLLTIHNTGKPILCLCPIRDEKSALLSFAEESTEGSPPAECSLQEYYQYLEDHLSSLLALKYHLSFKGDVEKKYHRLSCIVLQFDLTNANYQVIGDINIMCLYAERKPPVVTIHLVPKEPYPSVLGVNATFNTEDGFTYLSRLEPLHISFPELFVPLPVPPSCQLAVRYHLFVSLWRIMQPDDENQCEESIFCHKMSKESLQKFVESHFSKFVVSYCDHEYKIAILLPPKFHILIHAHYHEEAARLNIRTDNWSILPYLNSHLRDLSQNL
ncbi:PREDICTED: AP-5 complex subunit beta-1 [Nanorana parkeri]|uniref:AP-5 complex subunit beta-1 n=1 Tax=Nanorana parkeri TaxID=125878 RepID=UPI000854178C|nr:PREDICTED: AP-5 complex subunit beta-1 [Nanorana parkeri]